jgi:hypothetical protein
MSEKNEIVNKAFPSVKALTKEWDKRKKSF